MNQNVTDEPVRFPRPGAGIFLPGHLGSKHKTFSSGLSRARGKNSRYAKKVSLKGFAFCPYPSQTKDSDMVIKALLEGTTQEGFPEVTKSGALKVQAAQGGVASDGVSIPASSLEQTVTYNAAITQATLTVVYLGNTYKRTITYAAGLLSAVGQWVKQ